MSKTKRLSKAQQEQQDRECREADRVFDAAAALCKVKIKADNEQYTMAPDDTSAYTAFANAFCKDSSEGIKAISGADIHGGVVCPGWQSGHTIAILDKPNDFVVKTCRAAGTYPHGAVAFGLRLWNVKSSGKFVFHRRTIVNAPPPGYFRPHGRSRWFPLQLPGFTPLDSADSSVDPDMILCAWAFTVSTWSVSFSIDGAAAIRVATNAEGVKGLFSMRDREHGRSRRSALRHWVRSHHRKKANAESIDIAGYLRGSEEFDWLGFGCRVFSPVQLNSAK